MKFFEQLIFAFRSFTLNTMLAFGFINYKDLFVEKVEINDGEVFDEMGTVWLVWLVEKDTETNTVQILQNQSVIFHPVFLSQYGTLVKRFDMLPQWSATGGQLITSDNAKMGCFTCDELGSYRIDILVDADLTVGKKALLTSINVEVVKAQNDTDH
jgi:hypothetical protein